MFSRKTANDPAKGHFFWLKIYLYSLSMLRPGDSIVIDFPVFMPGEIDGKV